MYIIWKSTEGTQEQQPLEVEVCKTCVYLRKNIQRIERKTVDDEVYEVWSYLETKLSHNEYNKYIEEMNSASFIETINHLTDIQAEQAMSSVTNDINNETVMQTLFDIQADIALLEV